MDLSPEIDDVFLQDFLRPSDNLFPELSSHFELQDSNQLALSIPSCMGESAQPTTGIFSDAKAPGGAKPKKARKRRKAEVRMVATTNNDWEAREQNGAAEQSEDSEDRLDPETLFSQGLIDAAELQRLKNRAAQRRFRHRQRAKMQTTTAQVKDLTAQLNQMRLRQQELEARNGVLEHNCSLATNLLQELNEDPTAFDLQQEMILRDTARVYKQMNPNWSIEELKEQKTEFYICEVFPALLAFYRRLLESGGTRPGSPEAQEIAETVLLRRREENRVAAFSQWTMAMYAWNKEEMQKGLAYPSKSFWKQLLDGIQLSEAQQVTIVGARRCLLTRLKAIRQQREKVIFALGLAMLQASQSGSDREEMNLRDNLEAEREAVMSFLFTVIDKTLTPVQEAQLDVACYPWCPDLWHMASLLARSHGDTTPDVIRGDHSTGAVTPATGATLVPEHCTAEMLSLPLLAYGYGLQIKRGLASVPLPPDFLAAQQRLKGVTIARLRGMTCWDVMRGQFYHPPSLPQPSSPGNGAVTEETSASTP